jgi:hypothetical protein
VGSAVVRHSGLLRVNLSGYLRKSVCGSDAR